MTEAIKSALNAITDKVLAYRPAGKGEAAAKVAKKIKRHAAKDRK